MGWFKRMIYRFFRIDHIIKGYFKVDYRDRTIFFPWGPLGKGYIIEKDSGEKRITAFLKNIYIAFFTILFLLLATIGPFFIIFFLPLYIIAYFIGFKYLVRNLEPTATKIYKEKYL